LNIMGITKSRRRDYLDKIQKLRLMDDDFFNKCMEGSTECVELILHIIMDRTDLKVISTQTQHTIKSLQGRSVRLDVLAVDESGRQINIEIQREDKGAGSKRARYHSSILDANLLLAGENFEELPETYVIFITERDVLKKSLPLYRVERCVLETNEAFGDGAHIMYVNGENRDETPLGRLMHDFSCTDPEDMNYQALADRTRYFKSDEEGVGIMCRLLEDMRIEAMEEGRIEGKKEGIEVGKREGIEVGKKEGAVNAARLMLQDGTLSLEKIAAFAGLSYDEVKSIAENK
jgi:predicted transposase/invertase (TIGR01784 family)